MVIVRIEEGHPVPTVGNTICVTPRANKIHYFDASTGKRVEANSLAGQ
jgi:sn-glycerol 3-phosphate transport system ATP-binding protein